MPIPIVPVTTALAPGGMIVTFIGGYVAESYLRTAAIADSLTTSAATLGTSAFLISGAAASIVGSAGIFLKTIGTTGITGALISAGILPTTPIATPILAGTAVAGCSYVAYRLFKLKRKLGSVSEGSEAQFTEIEAKLIE